MDPGSNKWKFGYGESSAAKNREIRACRALARPRGEGEGEGEAGNTGCSPAREAKEDVGEGALSAPSLELLVLLGHLA